MMCYRYAVTHDKWLDEKPPIPKPPGGDYAWRLVSVIATGLSGSQIAFYWIMEHGDDLLTAEQKEKKEGTHG